MADVCEGVKDLLEAAGIGVFGASDGWSIHISDKPDDPDTVIAISQSGGLNPNPKWLLDYPGVQITVRGGPNGYEEAKQKVLDVKSALLGLPSQDLNGDRWVSVTMLGDVNALGRDDRKRPEWTLNFRLIIEPAENALDHRAPL